MIQVQENVIFAGALSGTSESVYSITVSHLVSVTSHVPVTPKGHAREEADMVLVTARSCRQRGVASGEAKVTNHRVQHLCVTNFHLLNISVIIMQTTTLQHLD